MLRGYITLKSVIYANLKARYIPFCWESKQITENRDTRRIHLTTRNENE